MNGLLIEDDPNKASKIVGFINEHFPDIKMRQKSSYQSGLKEIFNDTFKFILLDMSLPTYDQEKGSFSGKPRNFGGRDILKEMKRYDKSAEVLIITQYNEFDGGLTSIKELDEQFKLKFPNIYRGYVYYNSRQSEWKNELHDFLTSL